jgi:hypothetical protein
VPLVTPRELTISMPPREHRRRSGGRARLHLVGAAGQYQQIRYDARRDDRRAAAHHRLLIEGDEGAAGGREQREYAATIIGQGVEVQIVRASVGADEQDIAG